MKIASLAVILWTVYGLLVFGYANLYVQEADTVTYKYDRIDEVKKECASVLSSASEWRPDDKRVYSIKDDLSFVNGDWRQEAGKAPLMPFDDRELRKNPSDGWKDPLKLVSLLGDGC
jgi:hypothetical protein